jgi:hypothetical protein
VGIVEDDPKGLEKLDADISERTGLAEHTRGIESVQDLRPFEPVARQRKRWDLTDPQMELSSLDANHPAPFE